MAERTLQDLVFVGFNSQVVAIDRYSGDLVWKWHSPEGKGFPATFLDGDRLVVSVNGYTYCLDPLFGQEVWRNSLPGMGTGVPSITSVNGGASGAQAAKIAADQAAAAASASATT